MSEHSPAQKQYLLRVKREKNLIRVSRILLFLGFLILWEVSARFGWIDSFIFSSPSEIWITFLKMLKDQSLFTHIGITLARQFCIHGSSWYRHSRPSLDMSQTFTCS